MKKNQQSTYGGLAQKMSSVTLQGGPQTFNTAHLKQVNSTKLKSIYQHQGQVFQNLGASSTTNISSNNIIAPGSTHSNAAHYQKKMMLKNSNQLRNSYNSVGGGAHSGAPNGQPAQQQYQIFLANQQEPSNAKGQRQSQSTQKVMNAGGAPNHLGPPIGSKGLKQGGVAQYGKKNATKHQKDRFQEINRIYNFDYQQPPM